MKPFVRWSGNKTKYQKHIVPLISFEFDRYIEPFVGSGAIFLSIRPQKWIINDINVDLMNTWHQIKENANKLSNSLRSLNKKFAHKDLEEKQEFCHMMAKELNNKSLKNRALFFIMLKFCSYMGKIVKNDKYVFSGLDIKHKNPFRPHLMSQKYHTNLIEVGRYLNSSDGIMLNTDYKSVCKKATKNDFVFLDPPYIERHDYQFKYNFGEEYTQDFMKDLFIEVQKLDKKKVKWIMTQANTNDVRKVFREYKMIEMPVYRHTRKQYDTELIILGHAIPRQKK